MGKKMLWIFALTPYLSNQSYQRECDKLRDENGIDMEKYILNRIDYRNYVVGEADEDYINEGLQVGDTSPDGV